MPDNNDDRTIDYGPLIDKHNDNCDNDDYCSEPYHDYGFGHHHYDRRDRQHNPAYYPSYDAHDNKHHHHGPGNDIIVHDHDGDSDHHHHTSSYYNGRIRYNIDYYGPRDHDHAT